MTTPGQVLDFWFADSLAGAADLSVHNTRWFHGGPELDRTIAARFGGDIERAGEGRLDCWAATPRGRLALILLLDQFARNAWRGSPRAYRYDARAAALCRDGLERSDDRALAPLEREFFYMPLLHSERPEDQERGLACFERLLADAPAALAPHFREAVATARRYRAIIRRFGRFPHRNAVLGRRPTPSERLFLATVALMARLTSRGRR